MAAVSEIEAIVHEKFKYPLNHDAPAWRWFVKPLTNEQIAKVLDRRKPRCSSILHMYMVMKENGYWVYQDKLYLLPNKKDALAVDLADLSLTHRILGVSAPSWGIELALIESEDHTSNIDADMIERIVERREA